MKATLVIVCIFLISSLWSGAFDVVTQLLLVVLGIGAVFFAWLDEKKEKRRLKALKQKQFERSLRWDLSYPARSSRRKA